MEFAPGKRIPKAVKERTRENMEIYGMCLSDAFEEAARELSKKGTELWKAWYYSDFRAFIPSAYQEKYLDFQQYPLKYKGKKYKHEDENMTKKSFYTIHVDHKARVVEARLHHGYTDGTFNYYKHGLSWFVIHPDTGMSIAIAPTRNEARNIAFQDETLKNMEKAMEINGDKWKLMFSDAVEKQKAGRYENDGNCY